MRDGACPCAGVRYSIAGPVRDVVICHCSACVEATGGPWAASAVAREDLTVAEGAALAWDHAAASAYDASRGSCRSCGTVVFWDAPARTTVSFAVGTLSDASGLAVAARIWIGEGASSDTCPVYPEGLPESVVIPWRD